MDVRREVIRAAEERALALVRGDAERLGELLHEEFRWTSHIGETFGRREYIRRNTTGPLRWRSQELAEVEVPVVGDTAVLHAEVVDVVDRGGEPETYRMPMTQVWVREHAGWRCLAGHAGPRRE